MNKSLENGTKKFLENTKKILNSRGARLTYVVIIIVVILLLLTYGIMSITGQFKDKCPKDQSPQGPDQKCFNNECNQKTDDTCQDEIIGSKLQWDTANRPDCPECGCDDGYSIVKNLNNDVGTKTCVEMCGKDKFPDGEKQDEYVCAYVNRPKDGDNDDNEYLEYIPVGQVCSNKITFNGIPLSCDSDSTCKMVEKDKGYCLPKQGPGPGEHCSTGQNSFCKAIWQTGHDCGDSQGECKVIPLFDDDKKVQNPPTYCFGTNVSIDGQMCCDPGLMTLTHNIGTKGCCNSGETPVNVQKDENKKYYGCCPEGQTVSSKGICCDPEQIGTDNGECCDSNRVVKGAQGKTFCCDSKSLQQETNIILKPIMNSAGVKICSEIGNGKPFNVEKIECNSGKETFENYYTSFNNNYISMNDNNIPFNNSPFNNNYSENVYDNYGKENFGSPFPLQGGDCQFKNSQNDPNINLVCEDDKCRLACGKYEIKPGTNSVTNNGYILNHSGPNGLDYCKRVDCPIDETKLIFTPARDDNNVICTDGEGNNYWNHTNPKDITFTLTANMGKNCTEQDCFNVFDSLKGLEVKYKKIGSEKGKCKLQSNCGLLKDWGKEQPSIASIYNLNGTIEQQDLNCLTNRGSCKYLKSGTFCTMGSLDGLNCLEEHGTQNSVKACPIALKKTGFPFNIKCEQPSINNPKRRFYCKTTDGVKVNSGFGNGCCSFGNIVIANDIQDVPGLACQIGYFGANTWVPIYKTWGDDGNWNEGKNLRVLRTGISGYTIDGKPSRNLIILKNTKTGNYLNINNEGKLCETNGSEYLHLYYINNSGTGTKFGINQQFEVRFAGKQGISPHSFLAGRSKGNKVQGVVSNNNTQDPSKRGDIGFLTVDNGGGSPHDFPVRLIINQNDQNKCVLAAFHISDNLNWDGSHGPPRYLQNGLNDAISSDNKCIRLGRVDSKNRVRFNVYWMTVYKGKDLSYPDRRLNGGSGPNREYWDLSASAEYEIVAALREGDDEFMVNQFRGKLPSGGVINEKMSIAKIIEGTHQIRDIIHLLQNNLQPSTI